LNQGCAYNESCICTEEWEITGKKSWVNIVHRTLPRVSVGSWFLFQHLQALEKFRHKSKIPFSALLISPNSLPKIGGKNQQNSNPYMCTSKIYMSQKRLKIKPNSLHFPRCMK